MYTSPPLGTAHSPGLRRPRRARHTLRGSRPARAKRSPSASCLLRGRRGRRGSKARLARRSVLERAGVVNDSNGGLLSLGLYSHAWSDAFGSVAAGSACCLLCGLFGCVDSTARKPPHKHTAYGVHVEELLIQWSPRRLRKPTPDRSHGAPKGLRQRSDEPRKTCPS